MFDRGNGNTFPESTGRTGAGGYSIIIQASGAPRLIEGSSSSSLIYLNGADRVTFTGQTAELTFRNLGTGPTFGFANDSESDKIDHSVIEGGNIGNDVVIWLGAGIATGNDNITIANNTIRDRTVSPQLPRRLIADLSVTGAAANSNNVIANNELLILPRQLFTRQLRKISDLPATYFQTASRTAQFDAVTSWTVRHDTP